jgi:hypothetical protein
MTQSVLLGRMFLAFNQSINRPIYTEQALEMKRVLVPARKSSAAGRKDNRHPLSTLAKTIKTTV